MAEKRYLIIGGGVAGTTAADTIRQLDPAGEITIVSAEPHVFYSRIMISKPHFFLGKVPFDQIWLRKQAWYVEKNITFIGGHSAVKFDTAAHTATLDDGRVLIYDKLLLALGVQARRWTVPGADKKGVHYVRTLEDGQGQMAAAKTAKQAIVVGGGAIGFEMCELWKMSGLDTTLVIREPHYWDPVLDEPSGKMIEDALEKHGIKVIRNQYVTEAYGGESIEGIVLQDGTKLPCQAVTIGIGGFCPFGPAQEAGIKVNRGVLTNEFLETSAPDVWAAGDAAEYDDLIFEERTQFGSWSNAQMQGKIAGTNMAGRRQAYRTVTFYAVSGLGINIAFVGTVAPVPGRQYVARGSREMNAYARLILKDGRLVGATMLNRTAEIGQLAKLIEKKVDLSGKLAELADPKFDLKTLVV